MLQALSRGAAVRMSSGEKPMIMFTECFSTEKVSMSKVDTYKRKRHVDDVDYEEFDALLGEMMDDDEVFACVA